jgi:hypothetical protein
MGNISSPSFSLHPANYGLEASRSLHSTWLIAVCGTYLIETMLNGDHVNETRLTAVSFAMNGVASLPLALETWSWQYRAMIRRRSIGLTSSTLTLTTNSILTQYDLERLSQLSSGKT